MLISRPSIPRLKTTVIERAGHDVPPVFRMPTSHESSLRRFIALQPDTLLVLGPRRIPPLPCPVANTFYSMSIVTSVGFGTLESADYVAAVQKLRPDIVLGMSDVVEHKPGVKRIEKMGDRTQAWLKDLVKGVLDPDDGTPGTAVFAPILPIEKEQQSYYLDALQDDFYGDISGLTLHDARSIESVPATLRQLPTLCTADLGSPDKLLDAISYGIDLFTIPFVGQATDAGIALAFSFPSQGLTSGSKPLPLGLDMWLASHATDISPLWKGCDCFTCSNHHRAYLQHLLSAKEMLGWVLLQLHNHHVIDAFFEGVRQAIRENRFKEAHRTFGETYEADLPAKSGQGPRVRGYQYKSEGKGEPRKNPPAYRSFGNTQEKLAEARMPSPDIDAYDLEQLGFAEILE